VTAAAAIFALLLCASADSFYDRGMSLARLEHWDEARSAFELGREQYPGDLRFTLELAGIAFKQKRYPEAKRNLRLVLGRDSGDRYANDFLATIYSLEENTEAALKYWNRIGKPRIEEIRIHPEPKLDPVLLDRAFAFAPASVLERRDFLATRERLRFLEAFPSYRLDLEPRPGGDFDVRLRAVERRGWGALLVALSGAPFQTIAPQFTARSGAHLTSLVRWDKQKRRASASVSGPLGNGANLRYRFFADGRNENWIVHGLNLKKAEFRGEIAFRVGDRWGWSSGASVSRRAFRYVDTADPLFRDGSMLKYRAAADAWLLRAPERRFTVQGAASWESGRAHDLFSKAEASLRGRWFPRARGDDYEVNVRLGGGRIFGQAPFDELFMLGLERDNDLWLRAHIGTRDGKKGAAPLGSQYGLLNTELDKIVHDNGLFKVKLGPFVDTGAIGGPFGSRKWLVDAGVQCKVSVSGVTVVFSYGKALRSGANSYYATFAR
jgi:tetratricopeptide (TPR) repeat protein